MEQNFILVEGINIYENVLDTNQLSVIRGSSFLFKQAIEHITKSFNDQLTPLSTGASSGLFLLKNEFCVLKVSEDIAEELNKPKNDFHLFTFIIENCSAENLLQAKEQLIAQFRIRQMQSLTLAPDISNEKIEQLNQPDDLEGRRIAVTHREVIIQKQKRQLSHSVYTRWEYGKNLKQTYYFQEQKIKDYKELNELKEYGFSGNFEDLADNAQSKLNGKMAVIYIDGNSFGKKQHQILKEELEVNGDLIIKQQEFDQTIQTNRSDFLLKLLVSIIDTNSENGFNQAIQIDEKNKKIRFETLIWGGDEMLFVLPAWLGFEFIQYFFEQTSTQDWILAGQQFTHAAGVVFCNAKTPIRNIQQLAQAIAETVKDVTENKSPNHIAGRDQNAWNYIILESIDYPTNSNIGEFNKKHYGQLFNHKPTLIPVIGKWNTLKPIVIELMNGELLARRQIYRIVQAITSPEAENEKSDLSWERIKDLHKKEKYSAQETQELRLLAVSKHREQLLDSLSIVAKDLFSLDIEDPDQRIWLWIYLYELWDYIDPQILSSIEGEKL